MDNLDTSQPDEIIEELNDGFRKNWLQYLTDNPPVATAPPEVRMTFEDRARYWFIKGALTGVCVVSSEAKRRNTEKGQSDG